MKKIMQNNNNLAGENRGAAFVKAAQAHADDTVPTVAGH